MLGTSLIFKAIAILKVFVGLAARRRQVYHHFLFNFLLQIPTFFTIVVLSFLTDTSTEIGV
jgi:hypothetical protein